MANDQVEDRLINRLRDITDRDQWHCNEITEENVLEKLDAILDEWKQKYPSIDIANYVEYDKDGSFLCSHLERNHHRIREYPSAIFKTMLNAGVFSAELSFFYLRSAIAFGDYELCERVLQKMQDYQLDLDSLTFYGHHPLSFAASNAQPECIRILLQHTSQKDWDIDLKNEGNHPLVALQQAQVQSTERLVQSFEALIAGGIKIVHHAVHCKYAGIDLCYCLDKEGNIYDSKDTGRRLLTYFVREGLDLNIHYPNKEFRWAHNYRDLGVKVLPKKLNACLTDHEYVPDNLPIEQYVGPESQRETYMPVPDYGKIEGILNTGIRAENLACRCFSFGMLDKDMFVAILQAENKQRTKLDDSPLSAEQFFKRLPPFVQGDEALVSIRQAISHAKAAASEGIGKLRTAAQQAIKNQSELE